MAEGDHTTMPRIVGSGWRESDAARERQQLEDG
jgi:hypothetical protein